ncbi:hypothetical protein BH11PLA2_BH11PLA2_47400 [soil metagenome]
MIWAVAAIALAAGLMGTHCMRYLAPRIGLVDAPDGVRKLQTKAIPLGGGIAVFLAMFLGVIAAIAVDSQAAEELSVHSRAWIGFLCSCVTLLIVGLLDDWYELIARYKLLGQILAAVILVYGGDVVFDHVSTFNYHFELDEFGYPITVVFLLFAINSLNLLDGMDGLLGTVGVVVCTALGIVAYITGQHLAAAVAVAMAGALLGFLRYNLPPATIYLGDSGSMLVGLVIGALCVKAALKSHAVATLVPMSVLVLPFLDTAAAVIRRKLTGRSMAHADRDHLHHVLLRRGLSIRKALVVVALAGSVAGCGAVLSVVFVNEVIGLSVSLGVIVVLLCTGLFGNTELKLVGERVVTTARTVSGRSRHPGDSQLALFATEPASSVSALPPTPSP